jgi:protein ImuB
VRLSGDRPVQLYSAISRGGIVRAAGPWRTTGHWWSGASHFAFDHYDVQMQDGALLRVRFDWKAKQWQVDGVYD